MGPSIWTNKKRHVIRSFGFKLDSSPLPSFPFLPLSNTMLPFCPNPWFEPDPAFATLSNPVQIPIRLDSPTTKTDPDERRLRRKISNRESARRSRMRKQKRFEEITAEVDRLNSQNRVLQDRVRFASRQRDVFSVQNEMLRLELESLRRRFADLTTALTFQELRKAARNDINLVPFSNGFFVEQTLIT